MRRGAAFLSGAPRYGAFVATALIGVGIVVNALAMQHGHRTTTLFSAASFDRTTPTRGAVAKADQSAPAATAAPGAVPAIAVPTMPAAALPVAATPAAAKPLSLKPTASRTPHDDAIARLLGTMPDGARKKTATEKVAAKAGAIRHGAVKGGAEGHRKTED